MNKADSNRINARRSTGPRTPAGKARASRNATRHGLTARAVLLPDEDAGAFARLARRLRDELRPEGPVERLLVERVAVCAWRLRRLLGVEAAVFAEQQKDHFETDRGVGFAFVKDAANADAFGKLSRYEAAIERSLYKALHELERLQARRAGQDVPPPAALDVTVGRAVGAAAESPPLALPDARPLASFRQTDLLMLPSPEVIAEAAAGSAPGR
jgi:hypothetical protein